MALRLKKLNQQVMVITGASSGIGLVTARMAAKRGTRLVLSSRSEEELRELTEEIKADGGQAIAVRADVGDQDDVRRLAQSAQERFGGFDTWVNNAGISIYGKLSEIAVEDMRRVFETNFWGLIYGSLEAARQLRERGGAIINIGSTLSDRAIPMQGIYSASKHAVKGFTDALRMELESDGAPISVSLVKPGAIDTPYTEHAKNYMPVAPKNPPPLYAPETVARAILHCAENPERDVFVGAGGKGISLLGRFAPRFADKIMEKTLIKQQQSDQPASASEQSGLYHSSGDLKERGGYAGHVAESSLYTRASLHPVVTGSALVGAGLAVAALLRAKRAGAR